MAGLTEIFRQAAESRIITTSHSNNRGTLPDLASPSETSDFYFIEAPMARTPPPRSLRWSPSGYLPRFGLDPIGALPDEPRAGASLALQNALQPSQPTVERFGYIYRMGDKVMQMENNYDREVFNVDLGFIAAIDMEEAELLIDFDGRRLLSVRRTRRDNVGLYHYHPQIASIGVPGRRHFRSSPSIGSAISSMLALPAASGGRSRRTEEGAGDGCAPTASGRRRWPKLRELLLSPTG